MGMFTQEVLENKVKVDLIAIAKELNIRGRSLLKKDQLIERIIWAEQRRILQEKMWLTLAERSARIIATPLTELISSDIPVAVGCAET